MEFGVRELKRFLEEDTSSRLKRKLVWLQRKTLLYSVGLAISLGKESADIGIPTHEFISKTVNDHSERIARAGLPMPFIDRILFSWVIIFLSLI